MKTSTINNVNEKINCRPVIGLRSKKENKPATSTKTSCL
jgi:hypothetical protein